MAGRVPIEVRMAKTQKETAEYVDAVSLALRAAVPYPSTYTGPSIAESGPIPTDSHLVPSGKTIMKKPLAPYAVDDEDHEILGLCGKPWASYKLPQEQVFIPKPPAGVDPTPVRARTKEEEEMWKAQYMEWTLQKNAFNPDIAAALRTNVRKQKSLMAPPLNKPQDPARTSENVRAALSDSSITGPVPTRKKMPVDLACAWPSV